MTISYCSRFFFCSILLLAGCDHQVDRDYLKRFPRIEEGCDYSDFKDNISLKVHVFSHQDSKDYFGSTNFGFSDILIKQGFIPIHINIANDSNSSYVFRPSYIDLVLQPSNRIAKLLHVDTYNYVFWGSFFSLFFFWRAIPLFIIPMGFKMKRSNEKITENLQYNALQTWKSVTIAPYEVVDKFIFIRSRDFKQNFALKLFNEDERKLIRFQVDLVCGVDR